MLRLILLTLTGALCLTAAPETKSQSKKVRIAGLDQDAYIQPVRRGAQPLNLRPLDETKQKSAEPERPRLSSPSGIRFGFKGTTSRPTLGYGRGNGVRFNSTRNFGGKRQ